MSRFDSPKTCLAHRPKIEMVEMNGWRFQKLQELPTLVA